ncbi:MAG: hypothetical protein WC815_00545 [Vicinamibacterales bacterium]
MPFAFLLILTLLTVPLAMPAGHLGRSEGKTTPYSLAPAPFSGQMPDGWVSKKQSAQTTIFSAPAGTAEAEASIWIRLAPLVSQPDWGIDDYVADVQRANAKLAGIEWGAVDRKQTDDGRAIRVLTGGWSSTTTAGATTRARALFIFAEFPDYMAVGQYSAPQAFFDRLSSGFDVIWNSLTYGGTSVAAAPPASGRRTAFTIESPAYAGEMPEGWVTRRSDNVTVIEGAKGTEAYEMTIRLSFFDKAQNTLEGMASSVRATLLELPGSTVHPADLKATSEGRPARALVADYTGKDSSNRSGPFRQVLAIVQYDDHLVVLGYSGPASLHDKYAAAYEMVGSTLQARRSSTASRTAGQPKAQAPTVTAGTTKQFSDATFGIAFELPATWTYRVNAAKDYVIEGPKGTEAYELSVVLQFVTKAANPKSSATAQAQKLVDQIKGAPNGVIKTSEMLTIGGQEAPYFVATYTAADSTGAKTPFAHTQIVIDHGAYYYLVSYSGPAKIYEKYTSAFEGMVGTFRFTR